MSNKAQKTADEFITKYGLISIRMSVEQLYEEKKVNSGNYLEALRLINKAEELRHEFLVTTMAIDNRLLIINKAIKEDKQ